MFACVVSWNMKSYTCTVYRHVVSWNHDLYSQLVLHKLSHSNVYVYTHSDTKLNTMHVHASVCVCVCVCVCVWGWMRQQANYFWTSMVQPDPPWTLYCPLATDCALYSPDCWVAPVLRHKGCGGRDEECAGSPGHRAGRPPEHSAKELTQEAVRVGRYQCRMYVYTNHLKIDKGEDRAVLYKMKRGWSSIHSLLTYFVFKQAPRSLWHHCMVDTTVATWDYRLYVAKSLRYHVRPDSLLGL